MTVTVTISAKDIQDMDAAGVEASIAPAVRRVVPLADTTEKDVFVADPAAPLERVTDADGNGSWTLLESDDVHSNFRPMEYVLRVGHEEVWQGELTEDKNVWDLLTDGSIPNPSTPANQKGWITRRVGTTPFDIDGVGSLLIPDDATGDAVLTVYDERLDHRFTFATSSTGSALPWASQGNTDPIPHDKLSLDTPQNGEILAVRRPNPADPWETYWTTQLGRFNIWSYGTDEPTLATLNLLGVGSFYWQLPVDGTEPAVLWYHTGSAFVVIRSFPAAGGGGMADGVINSLALALDAQNDLVATATTTLGATINSSGFDLDARIAAYLSGSYTPPLPQPPDMDDTYVLWSDEDPTEWISASSQRLRSALGIPASIAQNNYYATSVGFITDTDGIKIRIHRSGLGALTTPSAFPVGSLGTGTADDTTFLRGDGSWQTVGPGRTDEQVRDLAAGQWDSEPGVEYDDAANELRLRSASTFNVIELTDQSTKRGGNLVSREIDIEDIALGERIDFIALYNVTTAGASGGSIGVFDLSVSNAGTITRNNLGSFEGNQHLGGTNVVLDATGHQVVVGGTWTAYTNATAATLYLSSPAQGSADPDVRFDLTVIAYRYRGIVTTGSGGGTDVVANPGNDDAQGNLNSLTIGSTNWNIGGRYGDLLDRPIHRVGHFSSVTPEAANLGRRYQDNLGHQAVVERETVAGVDRVVNVIRVPLTATGYQGAVNDRPTSFTQADAGKWWLVRSSVDQGAAPFDVVDADGRLQSYPHPPITNANYVGRFISTDQAEADSLLDLNSYMAIPPSMHSGVELYHVDPTTFVAGSVTHTVYALHPTDTTDALIARIAELEALVQPPETLYDNRDAATGLSIAAGNEDYSKTFNLEFTRALTEADDDRDLRVMISYNQVTNNRCIDFTVRAGVFRGWTPFTNVAANATGVPIGNIKFPISRGESAANNLHQIWNRQGMAYRGSDANSNHVMRISIPSGFSGNHVAITNFRCQIQLASP